jgi:hypothetical protein
VRRLLVKAKVPTALILVTLMMDVLSSSETSVLTRVIRRNITEDGILKSLYCFDEIFVAMKQRNNTICCDQNKERKLYKNTKIIEQNGVEESSLNVVFPMGHNDKDL